MGNVKPAATRSHKKPRTSWVKTRDVHPSVKGSLPFGGHTEYASGEERILVRGWLHLLGGVAVFLVLYNNWEWISTLPKGLRNLLVINCVKGMVSGTLHVLVPPHAPLAVLFAVHFVDIVVIVLAMSAAGMAYIPANEWGLELVIATVGSIIVGLCEAPLWPLKLMRPPGKEHFSVKIRYATMLVIALYNQYIIWNAVTSKNGGTLGSTNYWIQFVLYCFGFYQTVRALLAFARDVE